MLEMKEGNYAVILWLCSDSVNLLYNVEVGQISSIYFGIFCFLILFFYEGEGYCHLFDQKKEKEKQYFEAEMKV